MDQKLVIFWSFLYCHIEQRRRGNSGKRKRRRSTPLRESRGSGGSDGGGGSEARHPKQQHRGVGTACSLPETLVSGVEGGGAAIVSTDGDSERRTATGWLRGGDCEQGRRGGDSEAATASRDDDGVARPAAWLRGRRRGTAVDEFAGGDEGGDGVHGRWRARTLRLAARPGGGGGEEGCGQAMMGPGESGGRGMLAAVGAMPGPGDAGAEGSGGAGMLGAGGRCRSREIRRSCGRWVRAGDVGTEGVGREVEDKLWEGGRRRQWRRALGDGEEVEMIEGGGISGREEGESHGRERRGRGEFHGREIERGGFSRERGKEQGRSQRRRRKSFFIQ